MTATREVIDRPPGEADARAWVSLGVMLIAAIIVVLDTTIVNVAIPTIMDDFGTTLPAVQWVITGYSLTVAAMLVIGGRLGDLHGHRRTFIAGAALFAAGSLLASESWNVASLIVGEAIIEGFGASLMLPATLAVLSTTFTGSRRATAFAAWGSIVGSAAALGPLLGGWLTTDFSWRWSFRINVIVAPLAIVGALLFIDRDEGRQGDETLDVGGAAFLASGLFLLVLALTEGGSYGWWSPLRAFTIGGAEVWPANAPVSIIPVLFLAAFAVLCAFYRWERWRERTGRSALFEFGLLRYPTFKYGLVTTTIIAIGQFGMMFSMALFLQDGKHLSAFRNGLWMMPTGVAMLVAAPLAGRMVGRFGGPAVVRAGLVVQTAGLLYLGLALGVDLTFLQALPALIAFGLGAGFASSQLTSVILSEIPAAKSGVASGTNSTSRQIGAALGIAVIGTLVGAQASVVHGSRSALLFAAGVVVIGTFASLLIPRVTVVHRVSPATAGH